MTREKSTRRERTLTCQKRGIDMPASQAACPFPDEACKYRTDCLIHALDEEERREAVPAENPTQEVAMEWRISDPSHLLGAMRVALAQGGHFLTSRIAPNGPILGERNVSYIHKASWGLYAAGADHDLIARLLDWAAEHALRQNGDFYFPDEPPEYKDLQRVYRPLTFGKVAAWIGHPLIREGKVLDRILQYQHASGGAFNHIGDNPDAPETPPVIGNLNTTFFGQLMIALDMPEQAIAAGEWVRRWVEANRPHMANGTLYTTMTRDGELVTDVAPGERIAKLVDTTSPKQEFWQTGTTMAYLALLYDTLRTRWQRSEEEARPYLDAALALLDFERTLPLDTYLWPSKCKVGWGAGELLRVLVEHDVGDDETIEAAYRVAERVALFTFLDNQLPTGGWAPMHYPLDERDAVMRFSYKPLKGTVSAPPHRLPDAQAIWLPAEEITGEFLGEMKHIEDGLAAWLSARRPDE
jgi:hypothetical protein